MRSLDTLGRSAPGDTPDLYEIYRARNHIDQTDNSGVPEMFRATAIPKAQW